MQGAASLQGAGELHLKISGRNQRQQIYFGMIAHEVASVADGMIRRLRLMEKGEVIAEFSDWIRSNSTVQNLGSSTTFETQAAQSNTPANFSTLPVYSVQAQQHGYGAMAPIISPSATGDCLYWQESLYDDTLAWLDYHVTMFPRSVIGLADELVFDIPKSSTLNSPALTPVWAFFIGVASHP